ncbi:MAG: radical SAM protein [Candidatus Aminicenantes bacterium]
MKKIKQKSVDNEKILLVLPPFWTPQIPPLGISCLKSFLQPHGYKVKAADANVENQSRTIYDQYFDTLRQYVSAGKRGNFYNVGHEVLQNHLMANLNYKVEQEYIKLIKILIFKTFYCELDDPQVFRLNDVVEEFYTWLETYFFDLLEREQPSVLGLSVTKGNIPASMFAFELTRKKYPSIKTVMGGAVFSQTLAPGTPDFQFFLKKTTDYIDKIIIGEGEQLFLKLLKGELPEGQRVYTLADVSGSLLDLSTVDVPDFSGLDVQFYPNLAAYTSRSCPYRCSFCTETVYWGKYRKKSAEQVVKELSKLYKKHRSQLFLMGDSLLNPVINDLANEFINSDISIYWDGYLRIDNHVCDPDTVMMWRRGGFYRARLGVESGSQRLLKAMGKNITRQQTKTAIANLANAGIKTTTYWIVGYPGETERDFQQTLDLIEELKDDLYEAECNPFGFYLSGQVNSQEWNTKNKVIPLYPPEAKNLLILQSWIMDCEPTREETYQRVNRFVQHCSKLGIANPYSLVDINRGDQRWKKLHKNAVPSLLEFKNRNHYIDENKHLKTLFQAQNPLTEGIAFGF